MSHRNRHVTIVYRRIEFVTWISSIVMWNLSRGYCLSPHRICHVDIVYCHIVIVYCHIVIVYHRINVVTCSSLRSATLGPPYLQPSTAIANHLPSQLVSTEIRIIGIKFIIALVDSAQIKILYK